MKGVIASTIEGAGMTEVLLLALPLYSNRAQPLGSSCREAARPCFEKSRQSCNAMLRMEVVLAALFGCFLDATVVVDVTASSFLHNTWISGGYHCSRLDN